MGPTRRNLPVIYGGHDLGPRPETRHLVHDALVRGVDPVTVVAHVGRGVSDVWAMCLTADGAAESRPACARGCAWCCHQRVEVTGPEVFAIARRVETASPSLRLRLSEAAARHMRRSSREHFVEQCPCPFLGDGEACEIYDERPLACRRASSVDARVCESLASDPSLDLVIPASPAIDWNTSAVTLGYYEGMQHAGFAPDQYELAQAVELALQTSDAELRWRRGEDVLAAARTRTAEELVDLLRPGSS